MFSESEEVGYDYEYDPVKDFRIWRCKVCKHYSECPAKWLCRKMKEFIEREEEYATLDYDDTTI